MSTKGELLALLEARRGEVVSGEQIALKLGVSRAAVWKAVNALRGEGLQVQPVPGSGYRLLAASDLLSEEALLAILPALHAPVRVLQSAGSTNTEAKRWAIEGAPHGSLVVASQQQNGRGRLGRRYESPPGGIYMSIVLRPALAPSEAVLITAATAVAVCEAVQDVCGLSLGIKWVNDLFFKGKKCCGILTEAGTGYENGGVEYIVVGIGVNYTVPAYTGELGDIAVSLYPDGDAPAPRARLICEIYTRVLAGAQTLPQKEFLPEYRRRSVVLGKTVSVAANPPYNAVAQEIDEQARLVVRRDDGRQEALSSSEISVKLG